VAGNATSVGIETRTAQSPTTSNIFFIGLYSSECTPIDRIPRFFLCFYPNDARIMDSTSLKNTGSNWDVYQKKIKYSLLKEEIDDLK
jgi:hypothetical protein